MCKVPVTGNGDGVIYETVIRDKHAFAPGPMEATVIPWELLDKAQVPGSSEELTLYRRGEEFSIRVDGAELMNSRAHGSEEALAEMACGRISKHPSPRVLIGGLGLGYTAASALKQLGASAEVEVAEIVPAVVEWNREFFSHLAGHPLRDKRTTVKVDDVARILSSEQGAYDAIMLDVDNGPEGMSRKGNEWLYTEAGIDAIFSALRPGGVFALWSVASNRAYTRRLRRAGFNVQEVSARGRGSGKGAHHTIWIATRNH
jgi:spermidine synthase